MIDTHYDLLSIAYVAYLKNEYSYLEEISKYFHENNVVGVIANLYFMSKEEMIEELYQDYFQDDVSVLEMFTKAKKVLDTYLPDTDILYSIEGADYIKDSDELQKLHGAGLDCLVLTWNTKSRYASGNRSNQGLTEDGKDLLKKAIDLGIGIDLSHANEESFSDMIEIIRQEKARGKDVCCYASHSNSRQLCDVKRNLEDYQLKMIKEVDGQVGLLANRNFVVSKEEKLSVSQCDKENRFLDHIKHVASIVGEDNVMIATDDMNFCKDADSEYGEVAIFDYENVASSVAKMLSYEYDYYMINMIMHDTAQNKIFNKIKNKRRGVKK